MQEQANFFSSYTIMVIYYSFFFFYTSVALYIVYHKTIILCIIFLNIVYYIPLPYFCTTAKGFLNLLVNSFLPVGETLK